MNYLSFTERKTFKKTKTYDIASTTNDCFLGVVQWYAPWRRYCFYSAPRSMAIYDLNCLQEICSFIVKLMNERAES